MTDVTGENSGNCKNGKSDEGGKSGKLQPKLRFKGFTDAWEQRALGELIPHKRVTVNPVSGTYYRLWSIPSYDAGNPELVDGNQIKSTKQIVQNNDVLLGKINPRINRVWVVAIQPLDLAINIASTEWIIFRSTTNNSFDPYFILSFLSAPNTRTRLMSEVTGATGSQKRFQPASIAQHPYYTSSLPEQECIGSLFRCLDSLIAAAERKARLLRKKKHAYLNHIFTQHLRFTGHTTPWHQQAFKELVSRQSKTNGFSLLPTVEYEDIIPGEGRLNKNIYKKKKGKHGVLFQQGDILFGKLRPYLKNWVFAEFDGIAVGDFWVLRRLTGMNNRFLFFLIQSPSFEAVSSLSTGTKMPRADWNLVSNTLFSIPTEQAEIARFFQTLDSLIAAAERKVSLLKKRKQAYLQKMFV